MGKKYGQQTWVYLMIDLRSGFVKIGESLNPKYRETTLQAEQPMIELIEAWYATADEERFLHERFAEKRVRGEWFALTDDDLGWINCLFAVNDRFLHKGNAMTEQLKKMYPNGPKGAPNQEYIDELRS